MSATNDSILNAGIARGLVLDIANALIDQPEAVQIEVLPDGEGLTLRLAKGRPRGSWENYR